MSGGHEFLDSRGEWRWRGMPKTISSALAQAGSYRSRSLNFAQTSRVAVIAKHEGLHRRGYRGIRVLGQRNNSLHDTMIGREVAHWIGIRGISGQ